MSQAKRTETPPSAEITEPASGLPTVWLEEAVVILAFLTLLCCLRWQALMHLGTHYLGGSEADAGLYIWLSRSNARDFFTQAWFETYAFYPYGKTLAWSDNFILPSLFTALLTKLGLSFTVAYNTTLLSAQFLNGYCTYRLAKILLSKTWTAFFAGASFMSLGYFTHNLGHPQLQFAFFIPLALHCVFRFLKSGKFHWGVYSGLSIAAAFLTTVYFAVFSAALLGVAWLALLVCQPEKEIFRKCLRFSAGMLLGLLPLIPFVHPYLLVRQTFGERELYEAFYFSATSLSYLSASPLSTFYAFTSPWSHAEAQLFPGVLLLLLGFLPFIKLGETRKTRSLWIVGIALFLVGCALSAFIPSQPSRAATALCLWGVLLLCLFLLRSMRRLHARTGFFLHTQTELVCLIGFLFLTFVALSFGPLGNPEKHQMVLGPFSLFHAIVPGFDSMRAISRAGVVSLLLLCVLSAAALQSFIERKKIPAFSLVIILALVLVENWEHGYPLDPEQRAPIVFNHLSRTSLRGEALAVLPMTGTLDEHGRVKSWGEFARLNVQYMNWAFPLELPLLNGYSGQRTKISLEYPGLLKNFPDERSLNALSQIAGLRHVIFISQALGPSFNRAEFLSRAESLKERLPLILADEAGNFLFELRNQINLDKPFTLLTPPARNTSLHLDFLSHTANEVGIFRQDGDKETAIGNLQLEASKTPQTLSLPFPAVSDEVRPMRLTLKAPKTGSGITLERSRLSSQK